MTKQQHPYASNNITNEKQTRIFVPKVTSMITKENCISTTVSPHKSRMVYFHPDSFSSTFPPSPRQQSHPFSRSVHVILLKIPFVSLKDVMTVACMLMLQALRAGNSEYSSPHLQPSKMLCWNASKKNLNANQNRIQRSISLQGSK